MVPRPLPSNPTFTRRGKETGALGPTPISVIQGQVLIFCSRMHIYSMALNRLHGRIDETDAARLNSVSADDVEQRTLGLG